MVAESEVSGSVSEDMDPLKPSVRKRAHLNIITPVLVSALDRCKISDRKAVHIAAAVATSLGKDANTLNINRSSIKRARQLHRSGVAIDVKMNFKVELTNASLMVHWDSKLLPGLTGKEKIDRLPILVSGSGIEQLLTVPKLVNGSGEAVAAAVYAAIAAFEAQCIRHPTYQVLFQGTEHPAKFSNQGSWCLASGYGLYCS